MAANGSADVRSATTILTARGGLPPRRRWGIVPPRNGSPWGVSADRRRGVEWEHGWTGWNVSEVLRLRAHDVDWRQLDGQLIVDDRRSATHFEVNATGSALWADLVEGSTVEQLVARLVGRYGIDRSAAERDVRSFLGALTERGLLERGPSSVDDDG